jgi:hypothetical protein
MLINFIATSAKIDLTILQLVQLQKDLILILEVKKTGLPPASKKGF